jgi:hypothetical protein
MEGSRQKSSLIRKFILDTVSSHPADIVKIVAQKYSISRQAAARHIKKLVNKGDIEIEGNTSGRIYRPSQGRVFEFAYIIADRPEKDAVWKKDVLPLLQSLPGNVLELWSYCFEKIFNHSIYHSGGTIIRVHIIQQKTQTTMNISDDGAGIFHTIKEHLKLDDDQHAALELSKGKFATAPDSHIGLDIILSSRMADYFAIAAGRVIFAHQHGITWDWALDTSDEVIRGTFISMTIENNTLRTFKQVLKEYVTAEAGDSFVSRICLPVRLAQYGTETLFSRSQARRILARIHRFTIAILDFHSVDKIGSAFADQIFRVFSSEHPEIQLLHCNANRHIEAVIKAAKNNSAGPLGNPGHF